MICQEVIELIQRDLDRDLAETENRIMMNHIRSCTSCAAMFERLRRLADELERLPQVVPPFSLVDAILPRLEQLDLSPVSSLAGKGGMVGPSQSGSESVGDTSPAGNGAEEAGTASEKMAQYSFWRRIPYKTLGGVIAAGIVLGLMITNFSPKVSHDAESPLLPRSSDMRSAESTTQKRVLGTADHQTANTASADRTSADSASAIDEGATRLNVGFSDADKSEAGTDQSQMYAVSASPPVNDSAGDDMPERTGTDAMPNEISGFTSSAFPQESNVGEISVSDASGTNGNDAPASVPAIVSPDGAWTAVVEYTQIVIIDRQGAQRYITAKKEAESVYNLSWSEDSRFLNYDVTVGTEIQHFQIDLTLYSEMEIIR